VRAVSISADRTSPQPNGATITFTATPTGGVGPVQYKWVVFNGATWSTARDWSTGATFAWTPTTASPGYYIGVWARSAGGTIDWADAIASTPFVILQPRISSLSLTADKTAPQPPGTTITFTATAGGGPARRSCKFLA